MTAFGYFRQNLIEWAVIGLYGGNFVLIFETVVIQNLLQAWSAVERCLLKRSESDGATNFQSVILTSSRSFSPLEISIASPIISSRGKTSSWPSLDRTPIVTTGSKQTFSHFLSFVSFYKKTIRKRHKIITIARKFFKKTSLYNLCNELEFQCFLH